MKKLLIPFALAASLLIIGCRQETAQKDHYFAASELVGISQQLQNAIQAEEEAMGVKAQVYHIHSEGEEIFYTLGADTLSPEGEWQTKRAWEEWPSHELLTDPDTYLAVFVVPAGGVVIKEFKSDGSAGKVLNSIDAAGFREDTGYEYYLPERCAFEDGDEFILLAIASEEYRATGLKPAEALSQSGSGEHIGIRFTIRFEHL
ncbi:MAG: hypothetical protein IKD69_14575 [Solobacterium sp.]|nr:hypothetical protein [Solobacterium sp.]